MDNGFPFTTEPNALKEMIAAPSMMRSLTSTVTGQANNVAGLGRGGGRGEGGGGGLMSFGR